MQSSGNAYDPYMTIGSLLADVLLYWPASKQLQLILSTARTANVWRDLSMTGRQCVQEGENPDPEDSYGMIFKEYPKGLKGTFGTFRGDLRRGWIFEEETVID